MVMMEAATSSLLLELGGIALDSKGIYTYLICIAIVSANTDLPKHYEPQSIQLKLETKSREVSGGNSTAVARHGHVRDCAAGGLRG